MARLEKDQRSVVRRALRVAKRKGASPREQKALVEALGVESNYRDVSHGDRDSSGALQQRPSQGWGSASESLETDVAQFLERARKANTGKGSAGQLAQSVQRSAFPERYDQRSKEADELRRRFGGGNRGGGERGGSPSGRSSSRSTRTKDRFETVPAVSREEDRKALKLQYLQQRKRDPKALLSLKAGLDAAQDVPEKRVKVGEDRTTTIREGGSGSGGGSADSGSGGKRGKGSGLHELFWQGQGGINVKKNKRVPQGFVSGHTDHVHVAAGPRTLKRIAKLAKKRGLRVGEMEPYDKVDPVHVKGSYHYSGRAADISGDPRKMSAFAREVARKYKK